MSWRYLAKVKQKTYIRSTYQAIFFGLSVYVATKSSAIMYLTKWLRSWGFQKPSLIILFQNFMLNDKGQLISKVLFGVFNSPKKRTKNVCPSRLGQKFEFSSSFLGELKTLKRHFEINWPLRGHYFLYNHYF